MDDSIKIYKISCRTGKYDSLQKRLEHVEKLVECIHQEIFTEPFGLKNSPFICEAVELTKDIDKSEPRYMGGFHVSLWDAYYIVRELLFRIENNAYGIKNSTDTDYLVHMFQACTFQGSRRAEIDKLYQRLKSIKKIVEAIAREVDRKREAGAYAWDMRTNECNHEMDRSGEVPNREDKGSTTSSTNESLLVESQQKLAKKIELRVKNNQSTIQSWHNSVNDISGRLLEIQPAISSMLERIMSFSSDLTDNYVLQFARMSIDLFNLISDNYDYHASVSETSGNKDYINAVLNYKEFQSVLVDNLAAFGIEEITSSSGVAFDRTIHEVVDSDNFSPRSSVVKESLRSGFRYGSIVIQKERIRVEGKNETWY